MGFDDQAHGDGDVAAALADGDVEADDSRAVRVGVARHAGVDDVVDDVVGDGDKPHDDDADRCGRAAAAHAHGDVVVTRAPFFRKKWPVHVI